MLHHQDLHKRPLLQAQPILLLFFEPAVDFLEAVRLAAAFFVALLEDFLLAILPLLQLNHRPRQSGG